MTTKSTLKDSYRDFSQWGPCRMCTNLFDQSGPRYTRCPKDVCPWCYTRGWKRFERATEALDKIANLACLKPGQHDDLCEEVRAYFEVGYFGTVYQCGCTERCSCVTCFAGKVFDELFPERDVRGEGCKVPEPSERPDQAVA